MRYAIILAGGSGTRLWPWSRSQLPKQLLPLAGGRTLLQLAFDRLEGLVPATHRFVCAGENHRNLICHSLGGLPESQFFGEPMGRDTLNALGFCAAVLQRRDPQAVMAVCTADHLIKPEEKFCELIEQGLSVAEQTPHTLVAFGVIPTSPATAYGYLQLGRTVGNAYVVEHFCEKPDAATATAFFNAGPRKYLWNSGMFVWRASVLLDCIRCFEPDTYAKFQRIAEAYDGVNRISVMNEVYPSLKKISVDFAVMEPASCHPQFRVMAVPMPLDWVDVGSWNAFAEMCSHDEHGNAIAAARHLLHKTKHTLVVSGDHSHLVVTLGCEHLTVIHTPEATLVCHSDQTEAIKEVHRLVGEKFGKELL